MLLMRLFGNYREILELASFRFEFEMKREKKGFIEDIEF